MNIGKGEWSSHLKEHHPEESQKALAAAREAKLRKAAEAKEKKEKGKKSNNGKDVSQPEQPAVVLAKAKTTEDLGEAVSVIISPKVFQMSSALLWQAREAAIREWGWPADISPEDFVDTFLYLSFKQVGIVLGTYQVVEKP